MIHYKMAQDNLSSHKGVLSDDVSDEKQVQFVQKFLKAKFVSDFKVCFYFAYARSFARSLDIEAV